MHPITKQIVSKISVWIGTNRVWHTYTQDRLQYSSAGKKGDVKYISYQVEVLCNLIGQYLRRVITYNSNSFASCGYERNCSLLRPLRNSIFDIVTKHSCLKWMPIDILKNYIQESSWSWWFQRLYPRVSMIMVIPKTVFKSQHDNGDYVQADALFCFGEFTLLALSSSNLNLWYYG